MTEPNAVEDLRAQINRCRQLARIADAFTATIFIEKAATYEQRLQKIISPQDAVLLPNKRMG